MNQNILVEGDAIIGVVVGVSQRNQTNRQTGEVYAITELGVSQVVVDKYGNHQEHVTDVTVTNQQIKDGAMTKLNELKGKKVIIPVWHRTYNTKNGNGGKTYYLTNDWDKTHFVIQQQQAMKAAS